jgi:tetratricopeptide (TPR) repeat protein
MSRTVMAVIGVVVSLPLLFVIYLFTAASVPALDRVTISAGLGKPVAEIAMNRAGYGKASLPKLERVLRLDPQNGQAWSRRCANLDNKDPAAKLQQCQQALQLSHTESNLEGVADAQAAMHDPCTAEESYTRANRFNNASDTELLRNMGRSALECGHTASSIAIFEVAEDHDAKDNDEDDDGPANLKLDREWLVIANEANHNPKAAAVACIKAHPNWKSCHCFYVEGKVTCENRP